MVETKKDYSADLVAAARSVLLEVVHILAEYGDDMVLVGGWIPGLLLPNADKPHVGSTDIDLALGHRSIHEAAYSQIREILLARGYREGKQPFIFWRKAGEVDVEVDFLAGQYEGTGKKHRTQKVLDVRPRKARGCDLAFAPRRRSRLRGRSPMGRPIRSRSGWRPSFLSSS